MSRLLRLRGFNRLCPEFLQRLRDLILCILRTLEENGDLAIADFCNIFHGAVVGEETIEKHT
jgi:hypothetical protein